MTENLETQERVINLGKKLLVNLKKNEADEITSWMINYLAEQIGLAESGSKEAKNSCIEVILELWERRAILPNGTRPFESFEPIFKALESLSPESRKFLVIIIKMIQVNLTSLVSLRNG